MTALENRCTSVPMFLFLNKSALTKNKALTLLVWHRSGMTLQHILSRLKHNEIFLNINSACLLSFTGDFQLGRPTPAPAISQMQCRPRKSWKSCSSQKRKLPIFWNLPRQLYPNSKSWFDNQHVMTGVVPLQYFVLKLTLKVMCH